MMQQEIKFFWPLTEQIPLDLIYEEPRLTLTLPSVTSGTFILSNVGSTSYFTSQLTIDCDKVKFQSKKKHSFIQKLMHRAIGIKVEQI